MIIEKKTHTLRCPKATLPPALSTQTVMGHARSLSHLDLALALAAVVAVASPAAATARGHAARRLAAVTLGDTASLAPPTVNRSTLCDLARRYAVTLKACTQPATSMDAFFDGDVPSPRAALAPAPAAPFTTAAFTAPAEGRDGAAPVTAATAPAVDADVSSAGIDVQPLDDALGEAQPPSPHPSKRFHAAAAAIGVTSMISCVFLVW